MNKLVKLGLISMISLPLLTGCGCDKKEENKGTTPNEDNNPKQSVIEDQVFEGLEFVNVGASDGIVTTATDCKIINNSHGQVEIKNAAIDAAEGWTVVNYDKDMTKVKVGTKEFGFKIQNDVTAEDGVLGFTSSNWAILDGANDADTDELVLAYDMNCAAQATAIEGDTVADVIFTIGFYEAA